MVNSLKGGYDTLVFAGHSLGGTSAFCLTLVFPESRCVCFNPGAAPTNPIYTGPGSRATVYHIVGDIISSHMSPLAATIYRVKLNIPFGSLKCHSTESFFDTSSYSLMSATQEDELFLIWIKKSITGGLYANYSRYLQKQGSYKPVPGSYRDMHPSEYDTKGNKRSRWKIVNKVVDFLNNV